MEKIADKEKKRIVAEHIIPLVDTLPDFTAVEIDQILADKIRSGHQPTAGNMNIHQIPFLDAGGMVKFTVHDQLITIGKMFYSTDEMGSLQNEKPALKILRVFNN